MTRIDIDAGFPLAKSGTIWPSKLMKIVTHWIKYEQMGLQWERKKNKWKKERRKEGRRKKTKNEVLVAV